MRWSPVEIARFARAAGFYGDALTTATAVALATSGGNSTYDHRAGPAGAGRWQGLWGIDTDRWPDYRDRDLHESNTAASATHSLVTVTGGWDWSPVFRAGTHRQYLELAGTTRTRLGVYEPAVRAFIGPDAARIRDDVRSRLARTRTNIVRYRH